MSNSYSRLVSKRVSGKARGLLVLALGTAALVRIMLILFIPAGSDVFYYDRQAVEALLNFQNPYSHYFAGIPPPLATPGAERVFAYLPFTAIYLIPFYFLGDIRVGFVAADLVVAVVLYLLSRGRMNVPTFFLFVPFTVLFATVYLNNSLISILFLGLFILSEARGRSFLGAISFGIALSAIQFSWLLLPFVIYYYLREWRWKEAAISLAVAAAVIIPFFLAAPVSFYDEVVGFQFARLTPGLVSLGGPLGYTVNPSLNGFLMTILKVTLPGWTRMVLSAAILPIFALRVRGLQMLLARAGGYILVALFILPNDLFWSYTELPFVIFLAYLSLARYGRSAAARSPGERSLGETASVSTLAYKPRLKTRQLEGR